MNCCKHKYFVIYRGDDTDFPGNQELIVELNTERDLTGCSAHFSFQGFTQDFTEIPSDKKLRLVIPNSATGKFALGAADAKLWLTNGTKVRTVENRIHIVVTNRVDEAYNNDDPQAITVTISGGGGGATVVLDDTVTETSSNGVKSSGIWSWVKSLLPQWLTASYAEPATVESVNGKQGKITASGILKGNGQGGVTAATKSSTSADPANADYRDPTDNTCHKTEFGEWTFSGETLSGATYTVTEAEPVDGVFIYGVIENDNPYYVGEFSSRQTSLTAIFFGRKIVATRSSVCTDGKKFVTSDVVDGKVSSAVSTNNPAFVSAVQNTPAPEPGQGEDPPWGTWGTLSAAIAGLVAGLKWLKDKVFDSAGNIQDQFATDLLGKQVAKDAIDAEITEKGTAPDAHLEARTDERLKLILADNSVAYDSAKALPYKLTSVIGDRVVATMTLNAASTDITLPTIEVNDTTVKDFILDVTNAYAVEGVATDAGINIPRTDFKLVTRDGESLTDVTTVKAGKSAFICFTQKAPVVVDGTTYPCWCVIQLPFGDLS